MWNLRKRRGRGFEDRNHHYEERCVRLRPAADDKNKNQRAVKPLKSLEGWILFVRNLHEETSEDDLREAFGEYGEVLDINLNLDRRTGFVKGYALVEYKRYSDASNAREFLNQSALLGVIIKVDWCFH